MTALAIRGLSASYGSTEVLHEVDLEVSGGSLTAILGPSGSGKTTLLRVIAGFERPTAGTISLGDVVISTRDRQLPPERRNLGYVAQDGALFPHLTVARNIAFGLKRSSSRAGRITDLLTRVGLSGYGARYPHELSGGQQQRVALARALATDPPVILLDEPFAALDAALRTEVREQVAGIIRESGTTALLVTHDQDEALSMADQVAVLRTGRIVQAGIPTDLYRRPVDPELAQFVGAANLLTAVGTAAGLHTVLGDLPAGSEVTGPTTVMVRPEQLTLSPPSAGLAATVRAVDFHGHDAVVTVATADGLSLLVRTQLSESVTVGSTVTVGVLPGTTGWPFPETSPRGGDETASGG